MLVPVQVQLELFREAKQAVLKPNYVDKYRYVCQLQLWCMEGQILCYIYPLEQVLNALFLGPLLPF